MLMVNSFSGEEPVRAIRPMTQTGSGTFCFAAVLKYTFCLDPDWKMVRPERFELPTLWFVAKCSIQLSYGRDTLPPAETLIIAETLQLMKESSGPRR